MTTSFNLAWLFAVLIVIALTFSYGPPFEGKVEEPVLPQPAKLSASTTPGVCTTQEGESGEHSFSIAGMGIGTYSWQVELYYKKLGTRGNTTNYGSPSLDETTGETRYMLSVTYDLIGRATSLRGPSVNYGMGSVSFREDGTSVPNLGRPDRVQRSTHAWGVSEIWYFDSLGLDVIFVNREPIEYFLHQ